ncbi:hypothetical protein RKD19_003140 [Streptomyces canus]
MDVGGEVRGQAERLARGDQDEAVGALGHQGADLLGVRGVVQHDRHRQPRQMLVIQLAQPLDLLVGGGALTEQQLLARGAEPVQQMQQRVAGGERGLLRVVPAQVHDTGPAEVVLEFVRGPDRECRAAAAGRPVQHDHGGTGLGGGARGLHPLPDAPHLRPPVRELAYSLRELCERLLQHASSAGRRALVRAAQSRARLLRPGRRAQHPLLVEEGPDPPYLQRRQPLEPQLFRAAGLAEGARPVVCGRQVRAGHLHYGRRRARHAHDHTRAQRGARAGA